MSTFKNTDGKSVLLKMVKGIQDNKAYLGSWNEHEQRIYCF